MLCQETCKLINIKLLPYDFNCFTSEGSMCNRHKIIAMTTIDIILIIIIIIMKILTRDY